MRLALPALFAVVISGSQASSLRVLRASPAEEAPPTADVTVTFDRPVAGALDRSVDPQTIFQIAPAVPGQLEWRDPITLRFRPTALLQTGVTYTVTVASTFAAMDGSRLAAPHRFRFVVRGAEVLGGSPVFRHRSARYLVPRATFDLVVSTPVDLVAMTQLVSIELDRRCAGPRVVGVRAADQRPVRDTDPWDFKEAGGWNRDRSADSLQSQLEKLYDCLAVEVSPCR